MSYISNKIIRKENGDRNQQNLPNSIYTYNFQNLIAETKPNNNSYNVSVKFFIIKNNNILSILNSLQAKLLSIIKHSSAQRVTLLNTFKPTT
jgi:hypothetical protein